MTKEQLDALRWHTPAPWVNKCTEHGFRYVQTPYGHTFVAYTTSPQSMSDVDARIITATPDLINYIDEQQREIERLRDENDRLKVLLSETQSPCFPHVPAWFAEVVSLILEQEAGNDT